MDVFSHAIYGYATLRWRGPKSGWLGALLGAAPDLLYSGAAIIRRVVRDGWSGLGSGGGSDRSVWLRDGPPLPPDLVADYNDFYRYTHSLGILAMLAFVWFALRRKPPWVLLPWLLHILMDIPSHERYLTPVFFPFSDFTVMGMSWSRPPMLIANAVLLITVEIIMYWFFWRKRKQPRPAPWPEQAQGVA